jgi:hypothetical protein
MSEWFFNVYPALFKRRKKSFCLLLRKHLLILKIVPKVASNFRFGFPFALISVYNVHS